MPINGFRTYDEAYAHIVGKDNADELDEGELEAVSLCAARGALLARAGAVKREWRPTSPGSPCVVRDGRYGVVEFDAAMVDGWMDHPYRLVLPDKRTVFVSEPYHLDKRALVSLVYLATNGWQVTVRPEMALHYPGRTVAIWIERKGHGTPHE